MADKKRNSDKTAKDGLLNPRNNHIFRNRFGKPESINNTSDDDDDEQPNQDWYEKYGKG